MYSLSIALISILLVPLLMQASMYFGGSIYTSATAATNAAGLANQAIQISAAQLLFRTEQNRFPVTLEELVATHYLTAIPDVGKIADVASSPNPLRSGRWSLTAPNLPLVWAHRAISQTVCQQVNRQSVGSSGIRQQAQPGLRIQCFGDLGTYSVLIGGDRLPSETFIQAVNLAGAQAGETLPQASETGGSWVIEPTPDDTPPATLPTRGYLVGQLGSGAGALTTYPDFELYGWLPACPPGFATGAVGSLDQGVPLNSAYTVLSPSQSFIPQFAEAYFSNLPVSSADGGPRVGFCLPADQNDYAWATLQADRLLSPQALAGPVESALAAGFANTEPPSVTLQAVQLVLAGQRWEIGMVYVQSSTEGPLLTSPAGAATTASSRAHTMLRYIRPVTGNSVLAYARRRHSTHPGAPNAMLPACASSGTTPFA